MTSGPFGQVSRELTREHYGHLADSWRAEEARKHAPSLGLEGGGRYPSEEQATMRAEEAMAEHALTIPYSDDLLLSLKESPEQFEAEARLLLAVKLYELGRLSTGRAAALAGMERVEFIFALRRFGVSPVGVEPEDLERDLENARR